MPQIRREAQHNIPDHIPDPIVLPYTSSDGIVVTEEMIMDSYSVTPSYAEHVLIVAAIRGELERIRRDQGRQIGTDTGGGGSPGMWPTYTPSGNVIISPNTGGYNYISGTNIHHFYEYEEVNRIDQCRRCNHPCEPENSADFTWLIVHENKQGYLYCNSCYISQTFVCPDCQGVFSREEYNTINGNMIDPRSGRKENSKVCNICFARYVPCRSCGKGFKENDPNFTEGENGFCKHCVADILSGNGMMTRPMDNISEKKKATNVQGTIVKSMRSFGVEIETQYHRDKDIPKAYIRLPMEMGIGTDSSISGMGTELRSPPMGGSVAEEIVINTCKVLRELKFSVDTSCGFHVHLDVSDLNTTDNHSAFVKVRDLWLFHIAFEDVIMSILPPSRRGTRYCQTLRSAYSIREIFNSNSMRDLEKIWYRMDDLRQIERAKGEHRHESRYRGINMHTLFSNCHVEIRYHTGTINAHKILEWVNLHATIIDHVFEVGFDMGWIEMMANSTDLHHKTNEFFNYLKMPSEREAYLLARQESFRSKVKVENSQAYNEGMKVLSEEVER